MYTFLITDLGIYREPLYDNGRGARAGVLQVAPRADANHANLRANAYGV